MKGGFVQVTTTTQSNADAAKIAHALVEGRLAACAQVAGPITSTYWWQSALETADEYVCVIKTRAELYESVEAAILRLHPYETPEIVAIPILRASDDYLAWIERETDRH